eukprot:6093328-Pyramimonas_sp.AAC.1
MRPCRWGSTRTYDVRKERTGKLNSRVIRWLAKVITVSSTVSVSSPPRRRWSEAKPQAASRDTVGTQSGHSRDIVGTQSGRSRDTVGTQSGRAPKGEGAHLTGAVRVG